MRVTSFIIFNQLTRAFQENLKGLSSLYNKLSSGKKMDKPSDDVIAAKRAMDYKISINENEQYRKNIDEAISHLSFEEKTMSSVSDTLVRVRELAVQGATGTLSNEERIAIAKEVESLRDQLLNLANSKFRDRYVFSGFKTNIEAFNASSPFAYQGDSGKINVMIDKDTFVAINIPGDIAFSVGGATFFKTVDDLRIALENNDITGIQNSITSLDDAINQASSVNADIGARLAYLDNQRSRIEDNDIALKTILSNTEDADIAETVSELSKAEAALQALRQSGARVISQSLMDFLR